MSKWTVEKAVVVENIETGKFHTDSMSFDVVGELMMSLGTAGNGCRASSDPRVMRRGFRRWETLYSCEVHVVRKSKGPETHGALSDNDVVKRKMPAVDNDTLRTNASGASVDK